MTAKNDDRSLYFVKDVESGYYATIETLAILDDELPDDLHFGNIGSAAPLSKDLAEELITLLKGKNLVLEKPDQEIARALQENNSIGKMLDSGLLDSHFEDIKEKHPDCFQHLVEAAQKIGYLDTDELGLFRDAIEVSVKFLADPSFLSEKITSMATELDKLKEQPGFMRNPEMNDKFIEGQFLLGSEILIEEVRKRVG